MPYSNRTRVLEIVAVTVTGLGKFLFVDVLQLKFYYVIGASCLWLAYILLRIMTNKDLPAYWGFRKKGFRESLTWVGPVSVVVILVFAIYGAASDSIIFNWHLIPVLLLYPLWGTIQQFLIIALLARNLSDLENRRVPTLYIVLISSVVFSAVHLPQLLLVAATFFLAIAYTLLYLRFRNLWILGVFHGWLGGLFYFFVLGRDPWLEFIQALK